MSNLLPDRYSLREESDAMRRASTQGNCTLCKHSHMQEQLGETQRVCRKGPPTVVPVPQRMGVFMASMWPAVNDRMVCDAFERDPSAFQPHGDDVV